MPRVLIILLMFTYCLTLQAQELIPYTDGKLWGYCDTNGVVVITPKWKVANFFEGDRAAVSFKEPNEPKHYSIIDRKGNYIVPPEYHWNGEWKGWGNTDLNAHIDSISYGLVDTGGSLLVPMEYQRPDFNSYSDLRTGNLFLNVKKYNKIGVVRRGGALVVACEWDYIWCTRMDCSSGYFVVTKGKKVGLVDFKGRTIIPSVYSYINPAGKMAVTVSKTDKSSYNVLYGLIAVPSTRQILPMEYEEISPVTDQLFSVKKRGKHALYCITGKRLRRFSEHKYSPWQQATSILGELPPSDSILEFDVSKTDGIVESSTQFRFIDKHSLKPSSRWQSAGTIYPDSRSKSSCELSTLHRMHYEDRPPRINVNGIDTTTIVINGVTWHAEHRIDFNNRWYSLFTSDTKTSKAMRVVVDRSLNPFFTALEVPGTIINYNPSYGHIIYLHTSYNNGWRSYSYGVIDTSGKEILKPQINPVVQTAIIRGKSYIVSLINTDRANYLPNYPFTESKRILLDTAGKAVKALANYTIRGDESNMPFLEGGYVRMEDKNGMEGFTDVDGKVVFPKISFKYKVMMPVAKNRFIVRNDSESSLVDASGKNQMPTFNTTGGGFTHFDKLFPADPLNGYNLNIDLKKIYYRSKNSDGKGYFYISQSGKIFTNGFEMDGFKKSTH